MECGVALMAYPNIPSPEINPAVDYDEAMNLATIALHNIKPGLPCITRLDTLLNWREAGHIGPDRRAEDVIPEAAAVLEQSAFLSTHPVDRYMAHFGSRLLSVFIEEPFGKR